MASKALLIAIFVAVIVAPTLATDYVVGDADGWKVGLDYTAWAQGKDFRVGDTLTFVYKEGTHNVLKVNGSDFKQCMNTNTSVKPLASGNDVITLATPGKKWYICGVSDHCSKGMQLAIAVSSAEGPTTSPTIPPPTSAAGEVTPLKSLVWLLAAMTAFLSSIIA